MHRRERPSLWVLRPPDRKPRRIEPLERALDVHPPPLQLRLRRRLERRRSSQPARRRHRLPPPLRKSQPTQPMLPDHQNRLPRRLHPARLALQMSATHHSSRCSKRTAINESDLTLLTPPSSAVHYSSAPHPTALHALRSLACLLARVIVPAVSSLFVSTFATLYCNFPNARTRIHSMGSFSSMDREAPLMISRQPCACPCAAWSEFELGNRCFGVQEAASY